MAIIDYIDGPNRLIYLRAGVTEFHPVDDLYREARALRRTDVNLRKYDNFVTAKGNESKGGGKATPRFAILMLGTKIVPYDETGLLTVLGEVITDDADVDATTVITTSLINKKDVFFEPPVAEIVYIEVSQIALELEYGGIINIDIINGETGTADHVGTLARPSNNLDDALLIADPMNIDKICINGSLDILTGKDISGYTLKADRSFGNNITVAAGVLTDVTYFENLTVSGDMNGGVRYTTCVLGAINNFDGGAKNSLITGNIVITGTGANYFTECDVFVTADTTFKEINVSDKLVNFIRCEGRYKIINKTGTNSIVVNMHGGSVWLDSTCIAGQIIVEGTTVLIDESGAGCEVITTGLINKHDIAQAVYNGTKE